MIEAIRTAVPAYARPLEGAFGEGIRTGVIRALEQFVSAAEGRPMRPARRRDIYFELGRGEAREGRGLDALLAAYRVGARVAWRHAAAAARGAGLGADALAPLAEAVFAFIDELSARSAEGFAYEQSLVAGEAAGRRRALVQLMVTRPPAEPAAVEDAARAATWQLPATLAALFWRGDPEQRLASRLPIGSPSARLRDDTVCALVPDAGAPGRLAELRRTFDGESAALGPVVPWQETWRSAARAGSALALAAEGLLPADGLLLTDHHLPELALFRDRRLLDDLAAIGLPHGRTAGRERACSRRSAAGWITRAAFPTWPEPCTCTPRPCATASPSCARRSGPRSTTRVDASSSRWRCGPQAQRAARRYSRGRPAPAPRIGRRRKRSGPSEALEAARRERRVRRVGGRHDERRRKRRSTVPAVTWRPPSKLSESGNDQALTYAVLAQTHATLAVVDALSEIRDDLRVQPSPPGTGAIWQAATRAPDRQALCRSAVRPRPA